MQFGLGRLKHYKHGSVFMRAKCSYSGEVMFCASSNDMQNIIYLFLFQCKLLLLHPTLMLLRIPHNISLFVCFFVIFSSCCSDSCVAHKHYSIQAFQGMANRNLLTERN